MLKNAYHAADLFCLPSQHEPFGIVILEAWAASLPVVAAKVGGIPSFTSDGENILHVDPDNPEDIARCIQRLLSDPDLAGKLRKNGLDQARNRFDWRHISNDLLEIYHDIIA